MPMNNMLLYAVTALGSVIVLGAGFRLIHSLRSRRRRRLIAEEIELQIRSLGADMGFSSFTASQEEYRA